MKIREITHHIEEAAPLSYQENYDNAGLITGHPEDEVSGILLCIDCIEEVVEEAIRRKCNLIIAHHPILFGNIKRLNGKNYVERTIIKAIQNNIAIYAAHTNADNILHGVNARIAHKLGLENCMILSPKKGLLKKLVTFVPHKDAERVRQAIFSAGAGRIGHYGDCSFNLKGEGTFRGDETTDPHAGKKGELHTEPETRIETIFAQPDQQKILNALTEAHPYEEVAYDIYPLDNVYPQVGSGLYGELRSPADAMEFLHKLKQLFHAKGIRHTGISGKKIRRVALCGGSGSFLLNDAIKVQADIFITADFKYHQFFDADGKIVVADIGHYESEQFTVELFYEILIEKIPTFAIHFSEVNTNPVNYL